MQRCQPNPELQQRQLTFSRITLSLEFLNICRFEKIPQENITLYLGYKYENSSTITCCYMLTSLQIPACLIFRDACRYLQKHVYDI
jgi:hypothetical protein